VGGLYLVLWGKGREINSNVNANTATARVPDEVMVPEDNTSLPVFFSPKRQQKQ
jgi:hypothetical protein